MELVREFAGLNKDDVAIAGGKGASLGEMTQAGIPVPPGFVLLSSAFERFVEENDLLPEIDAALDSVDHKEIHTVENAAERIQAIILSTDMPEDIAKEIKKHFKKLNARFVAVRSSATSEDSSTAAWAGQLDTFLNTTEENLIENVKKCWASLFTPRAIFYRFEKELHRENISVAVIVQKMVDSEESGIAFSVHPVTQDPNQLIIEAGFGLGEAIVSGQITPDSYVVDKQNWNIIDKQVSTQERGIYRAEKGGNEWKQLSKEKAESQVLTDKEIIELSKLIVRIEDHYNFPVDIELAREKGKFYITQSRPITTLTISPPEENKPAMKLYKQAGNARPYPALLPAVSTINGSMGKYFKSSYGELWLYAKGSQTSWLWYIGNMEAVAKEFLKKKAFPESWQKEWKRIYKELTGLSSKISRLDLTKLTREQLVEKYDELFRLDQEMWGISIFIDAFDAGYDQEEIEKIAEKHKLTTEEVHVLITPAKSSYINEFENKLCLVKDKNLSPEDFIDEFFWLGTDYNNFSEIDSAWVREKAKKAKPVEFRSPVAQQAAILMKHGLKKNPLEIFKILSAWRDERKRLNYTGAYGLMRLLGEGLRRCRIPQDLVLALLTTEAEDVFSGRIKKDALVRRVKEPMLIRLTEGGYTTVVGEEAAKEFKRLHEFLPAPPEELKGTVACKGKVKGRVRVVYEPDSPLGKQMKKGDILVTSMTRPEFVPLMKKAGAILTDEGGISCHAAIVSRELNIPCIIGTKHATQVLKDGDEVEVDADDGIVRILKKAQPGTGFSDLRLQPIVTRKYVPIMSDFFLSSYSEVENYQKVFFCDFYTRCGYVSGKYYYGPEAAKFGDVLIAKEDAEKGFINKVFANIYELGDELLLFSEKVHDADYSKQGLPALLKIFKEFSGKYKTFAISLMGFNLQFPVEARLRDVVKDCPNPEEALSILSSPMKDNFAALEQQNLLRIGVLLEEKKIKRFEDITPGIRKKIKEHINEYGWINTRGGLADPWTEEDIFKRVGSDCAKKLIELEDHKAKGQKDSEKLLKELEADDDLIHLVNIAKELVYFRTYRTDYLNKIFANIRPLMEAIAKRLKLSYDELLHLRVHEIADNKDVAKDDIKRRMQGYALMTVEPHKIIFTSDPGEIQNYKDLYCEEFSADSDELKGNVAYKGKVSGTAKIVVTKADLGKVEAGDIMISPMTTPDMVTAMEKAAAFVTDEGGITCHAAIVSREMKKPCIIGTKVATQVMKDGDKIEVDADDGVVRKLGSQEKEWYHLGKWLGTALAAEMWLDYARYAQQFFKAKLDGKLLYLNGDFFLSQHDADIIKEEGYEAAKNKDNAFFDRLKRVILSVSDKITKASKNISSPLKFLDAYQELTGVWMPLNIVALGVEKYVGEIDKNLFNLAMGKTAEKPWTLQQVDDMRNLKKEIGTVPERIEELSEEIQKKVRDHISKYEWKGSHHFSIHTFTVNELFKQMNADQEEVQQSVQETGELVELLDLMGFIRFRCAEASAMSTYYLSKKLTELAERNGLTYDDLVNHTLEEIKAGELSRATVEKRKKNTGFLFDGAINLLTDGEIKRYTDDLLKDAGSSVSELKGMVACKGKAEGVVKFVRSKKEMDGFEKGMILVAYETTPDIIMAMKQAAAIVTDFGGLTSHAAIVSREFNIPCIVGTGNATNVLKDGDKVEVDADNGVVKVLERCAAGPEFKDYQRMFRIDNIPFLISHVWMEYYKKLEVLSFLSGRIWISYMPKSVLKKVHQEAEELFSSTENWRGFNEDYSDFKKRCIDFFKGVRKKGDISKKETAKMLDMLAENFFYYSKIEFFYTDKAFMLAAHDDIVKKHLKEFKDLKNESRKYLNDIFFGKKSHLNAVFNILSKRFGEPVEDLFAYSKDELLGLFDGDKVDAGILKSRRTVYLMDGRNNELRILQGEEALKEISRFQELPDTRADTIKGITANKGRMKGKVKVILWGYGTFDRISKMVDEMDVGDVLVTETTSPDLMAAIKKAGAIVANQGGLMSHAAIMSREFGIPCIVATNNATEVLKDGDEVEVDADKGIVRIIRK